MVDKLAHIELRAHQAVTSVRRRLEEKVSDLVGNGPTQHETQGPIVQFGEPCTSWRSRSLDDAYGTFDGGKGDHMSAPGAYQPPHRERPSLVSHDTVAGDNQHSKASR